jgi:type I restriction enzyme S subunit
LREKLRKAGDLHVSRHMPTLSQSLERRYPGTGLPSDYRAEIQRVCAAFLASGLADSKYENELTGGSDGKFWSCVSEALIFDRIKDLPRPDRTKVGEGPDFLLAHGSRRVWVEVVCPEPTGLPQDWLEIQTNHAGSVPHEAILLRWTSAIKDKTEKLIGSVDGRVKGYLRSGLVTEDDVYVIAVNGCMLRHGPFSALHGISQFPYAVEAVFPVGPFQINIDRTSLKSVGTGYQERYHIPKPNGASVPTHAFLDPRYQGVSAIWAVDFNGGTVVGNHEPSALVHNPFAAQPLPKGFLPADSEFIASPTGEGEFTLSRLTAGAE